MTVDDVCKYYPEFLKIARWHNPGSEEVVQDAVQTFYFRLCEIQAREGNLDRLFYNGRLNMVYVFTSLRNIIIDEYRHTSRYEPIDENFDAPDDDPEEEISTEEMCSEVRRELSEMREYDRLMTFAYYNGAHSIRSLARAVNISPKNVFVTLQRVKQHITKVVINNPHKYPKL